MQIHDFGMAASPSGRRKARLVAVVCLGYGQRMTVRYAIYAAPGPESGLWRFGSAVIGYDAVLAIEAAHPDGPPFDEPDWPALTDGPRRYGFHGTLKAPFGLTSDRSETELLEAVALFAARRPALVVPRLTVGLLKSFVALVPATPCDPLDRLAADCVRTFEPFRAPLSEADRARRLAAPLSERQKAHLDAWGYPYVFEDFRYHMTLTDSLAPHRREPVRAALSARYEPVDAPFPIDALAVFRQERRDGRFAVLARFTLEG